MAEGDFDAENSRIDLRSSSYFLNFVSTSPDSRPISILLKLAFQFAIQFDLARVRSCSSLVRGNNYRLT